MVTVTSFGSGSSLASSCALSRAPVDGENAQDEAANHRKYIRKKKQSGELQNLRFILDQCGSNGEIRKATQFLP
jgi:hypothetical protein